jgi:hypothetical protein
MLVDISKVSGLGDIGPDRLLWIVMTVLMSLALAGQEFRPSYLPGLRLTKRNS